jgi:hypothetical protein
MSRIVALIVALSGATLAVVGASLVLLQQTHGPIWQLFPLPFLALFDWALFGLAGAVLLTLSVIHDNPRDLKAAWFAGGALLPLGVLGAFSIGAYVLLTSLLLLAPAVFMTIRSRLVLLPNLGWCLLGALANLSVLLLLIFSSLLFLP